MNIRVFAVCAAASAALLTGGVSLKAQTAGGATTHYAAKLVPLNAQVTGSRAHGELRMTVRGGRVTIELWARGLPPGMTHMAHLHGFVNGAAASCPKAAADTNHDGIIDVIETEPASGITLIPLNQDPAALDITGPGYPKASQSGRIRYRKTVSLARLDQAMAAAHHGASADLDKRVVYIHGVPDGARLPASAASLPGVPAQATLPIACGVIERVR